MLQAHDQSESTLSTKISNQRLFASDFDGTKFLTSETGKGILSVSDAYAVGIDQLFGPRITDIFREQNGHNHRTPSEIVHDICPDMELADVELAATQLTGIKIGIITEQIGKSLCHNAVWPQPTDGFLNFWTLLSRARSREVPISTYDITAGHVRFIEKVYYHYGLELPDKILTDEVLIADYDMADILPEDRAKPATALLEIATSDWLDRLDVTDAIDELETAKKRTIYTGDSVEKDGGIAENWGVEFVLLEPARSQENWAKIARMLGLGAIPRYKVSA